MLKYIEDIDTLPRDVTGERPQRRHGESLVLKPKKRFFSVTERGNISNSQKRKL